jgi:hypothetical protein
MKSFRGVWKWWREPVPRTLGYGKRGGSTIYRERPGEFGLASLTSGGKLRPYSADPLAASQLYNRGRCTTYTYELN